MIRLAQIGDGEAVAAIYRPSVEGSFVSFELEPPDGAEMARRIAAALAWAPWLVWEEGGAVLAYAYASRHRERAAYQWSLDASVYVAPAAQRRGLGRALYRTLFALVRLQGFAAVHAGIALPNPASVGLHEALGFRPVGVYREVGWKLGAWRDVGWWQLPLGEKPRPPPPPRPLPAVVDDPAWRAALRAGPG